jgi:hypothetical protein
VTYDSTHQKVVIVYADGNSAGQAVVATVSGTSISFGGEVTWLAYGDGLRQIAATYDSSHDRVVIASTYWWSSAWWDELRVGQVSVSPDTITFGSYLTFWSFEGSPYGAISLAYDPANARVIVSYGGMAWVGLVSGLSISLNTQTVYAKTPLDATWPSYYYPKAVAYDSVNSKFVFVYVNATDSLNKGVARTATVTTSPDAITFDSGETAFDGTNRVAYPTVAYDVGNDRVFVAYADVTNSLGKFSLGRISGSTISFGSPMQFEGAPVSYVATAYDSASGRVVVGYSDTGNSGAGTGIVINDTPEFSSIAIPLILCAIPLIAYRAKRRRD